MFSSDVFFLIDFFRFFAFIPTIYLRFQAKHWYFRTKSWIIIIYVKSVENIRCFFCIKWKRMPICKSYWMKMCRYQFKGIQKCRLISFQQTGRRFFSKEKQPNIQFEYGHHFNEKRNITMKMTNGKSIVSNQQKKNR